ncbi:MAG: hypothetical protein LIO96_00240 [Lachnospiraceae bacterium]|nr:hypothetical protein [Lachnospiraceae bacterium]
MPDESLSEAERSEIIELFETTYGLESDDTADCMIYQRLSTVFVMLIPAILMLIVLGIGIVGLVRNRRKPFRLALLCIILSVLFFVFFRFFQISPSIPANLIPNTWSDFDFWREKLTEFAAGIRHLVFQNKSEIELNYYKPLVRHTALTGLGVILFVITNLRFQADSPILPCRKEKTQYDDVQSLSREQNTHDADTRQVSREQDANIRQIFREQDAQDANIRQTSGGHLFCNLVGVFVTEMIAICLLHRWGIFLDGKRMLIYLWPYFLIAKYVVTLID